MRKSSIWFHCPFALERTHTGKKLLSKGWFCTLGCALSWGIEKRYSQVSFLLPLLARRNYGILERIKAAPPQECLFLFGGPLSYEQFHESIEPAVPQCERPTYQVLLSEQKTHVRKIANLLNIQI